MTALEIPITAAMRQRAEQTAQAHPDPQERSQIARNLLAAEATNFYLQMLSIESEFDCERAGPRPFSLGQPGTQLRLKREGQIHQLECLPVAPGESFCYRPEWPPNAAQAGKNSGHLGYMAVEIPPDVPRSARLLGFLGAAERKTISLKHFQPLDAFLKRLHQPVAIHLGDWLRQNIENITTPISDCLTQHWKDWQRLDDLLPQPQQHALAFRARTTGLNSQSVQEPQQLHQRVQQLLSRAMLESQTDPETAPEAALEADPKANLERLVRCTTEDEELRWQAADLLWTLEPEHEAAGVRRLTDLGLQFGETSVALMVATLPRPDGNRAILLRLYPMGEARILPEGIELIGCDSDGHTFLSAQARDLDDYIQLKFAAYPEEAFTVKVLMEGAGVAEHFKA